MILQKSHLKCSAKHNCRTIYQQLGKAKGPSVARKVTVVFLLPLLVFIGILVLFEQIFTNTIVIKELQTAMSFLLSALATSIYILVAVAISKQASKNR